MVAIDAKCPHSRTRKSLGGTEVQYVIDEEIEKQAVHNDILAQICRTPHIHLERKKPTSKCLFYNEEVRLHTYLHNKH